MNAESAAPSIATAAPAKGDNNLSTYALIIGNHWTWYFNCRFI